MEQLCKMEIFGVVGCVWTSHVGNSVRVEFDMSVEQCGEKSWFRCYTFLPSDEVASVFVKGAEAYVGGRVRTNLAGQYEIIVNKFKIYGND